MIAMVRRFLVLAAVMFWQGGFTFYEAVVVPVGSEILGSHQDQGPRSPRGINVGALDGRGHICVRPDSPLVEQAQ
jgi:hypothetical protein